MMTGPHGRAPCGGPGNRMLQPSTLGAELWGREFYGMAGFWTKLGFVQL